MGQVVVGGRLLLVPDHEAVLLDKQRRRRISIAYTQETDAEAGQAHIPTTYLPLSIL